MKPVKVRAIRLRELTQEYGVAPLAKLLGYRNPSFITQLIKPNTSD